MSAPLTLVDAAALAILHHKAEVFEIAAGVVIVVICAVVACRAALVAVVADAAALPESFVLAGVVTLDGYSGGLGSDRGREFCDGKRVGVFRLARGRSLEARLSLRGREQRRAKFGVAAARRAALAVVRALERALETCVQHVLVRRVGNSICAVMRRH